VDQSGSSSQFSLSKPGQRDELVAHHSAWSDSTP
jgi:hypothetical protein